MANTVILASLLVFTLLCSPFLSNVVSCRGPCQTLDDCDGQLICTNDECNDDPDVGTHICTGGDGGSTPSSGSHDCQPSDEMTCNGVTSPTYTCSPPVTSSTAAKLTINDFAPGGDGGGASECDEQYHDNSELIVALSTGWYAGGSRCGKMINIVASNGNSVQAKVVDECDSMHGCDQEHANQGPCANNIVDASEAVWNNIEPRFCGYYLVHGVIKFGNGFIRRNVSV